MTSFDQRREAWDAGIAAAALHAVDGRQLVSPWGRQSRLTSYFNAAAHRTFAALRTVAEARP